ncbi:MAG: divalent-cation tolerance protein CutA [bacterium]|nr:divalent-cation tolerance protein CutA [bacterium]
MTNAIFVQTVINSKESANQMAEDILLKKLANCIQVLGPITSHFYWKNQYQIMEEYLLLIKSVEKNQDNIIKYIEENHPYDTPEVLCTPITKMSARFGEWLLNAQNDSR